MTLRHYTLWDHRKGAMIALWVGFCASYTIIAIFTGFILKDLYGKLKCSMLGFHPSEF